MDDKLILDFLRSLHEHKDEGERYLRMILSPAISSDEKDNTDLPASENSSVQAEESPEPEERVEEAELTPELPSEFSAHLGDSLKCLDGFLSGRRPSPDDWKDVFGILFSIISDATSGVISTATAETLLRAVSFDRAVGIALHEGEVKGRNARIEEQLISSTKSDGVPALGGARGSNSPRRSQSIFDLAGEAR